MEALTAASIAALTVYDMVKALEKGVTIESVALLEKSGGKSGRWTRASGGGVAAPTGATAARKRARRAP
jgi:hypothetical protein